MKQRCLLPSFQLDPESVNEKKIAWIPAFAGMTNCVEVEKTVQVYLYFSKFNAGERMLFGGQGRPT